MCGADSRFKKAIKREPEQIEPKRKAYMAGIEGDSFRLFMYDYRDVKI